VDMQSTWPTHSLFPSSPLSLSLRQSLDYLKPASSLHHRHVYCKEGQKKKSERQQYPPKASPRMRACAFAGGDFLEGHGGKWRGGTERKGRRAEARASELRTNPGKHSCQARKRNTRGRCRLVLRHAQHLRGPANELGVRGVLGDASAGRLGRRSTAFRRRAVRRVDVVVVDNGLAGTGAGEGADIRARHDQRVVVKGAIEVVKKG